MEQSFQNDSEAFGEDSSGDMGADDSGAGDHDHDEPADPQDRTTLIRGDSETQRFEKKQASEQDACLIIIRGSPQGQRYFLSTQESILGRDPAVEIPIHDNGVSRRHLKIELRPASAGEEVWVTDLGSSNGTQINAETLPPHAPRKLLKEDILRVGTSVFKFLPKGELETLYLGNLGSAVHTDALTGIHNKGYLLEAMEAEFKRAKALGQELSILFFDLDHFKKVNDTYGHDAGDAVLKSVTAMVASRFVRKKQDTFARYGGEEFVLLLAQTSIEEAEIIAEAMRAAVESLEIIHAGTRIPITSSAGVASLGSLTLNAQALLKRADEALYRSKRNGRNQVTTDRG